MREVNYMILRYLASIAKRSGAAEFFSLVLYIGVVIVCSANHFPGAWWILGIIGIAGAARFILCGAWYWTEKRPGSHQGNPQGDDIYHMGALAKLFCMAAMIVSGIFMAITDEGAVLHPLGAFLLYGVLGVNVFEALRTTALVLDKYDETWLQDKQGKVGFLCYGVFLSIAITAILGHLIVTRSFGSASTAIAVALVAIYAAISELVSEILWRVTGEAATRYFCWLECIMQRFFFVVSTISVIVLVKNTGLTINGRSAVFLAVAFGAVVCSRDIWLAVKHFNGEWHPYYISLATNALSVGRRVLLYAWLIASLIVMAEPDDLSVRISVFGLMIIACVTVCCILSDVEDMKRGQLRDYQIRGPY
jgi:hypothetical protein